MCSFTNAVQQDRLASGSKRYAHARSFRQIPQPVKVDARSPSIKELCPRRQAIAQVMPACDGKSKRSSCLLFLVLRTPRSRGRGLM